MNGEVTAGGIVIIGGGQAGGWAARTLRGEGYHGPLTVISDELHDFYERPPLSKQVLSASDDSVNLSRLFSEQEMTQLDIEWRRPQRVEQINPQKRSVLLTSGEEIAYHKLLIATGARARVPVPEWLQYPQVMTLRSWDDACQLRQRLQQCDRLAVIGGGWIGLEIAATARQLGKQVTLFERQPALCMRSVDATVSATLLQMHQQQGVQVYCDCGEIVLHQGAGDALMLSSDKSPSEAYPLVVVGAGIELNLHLARQAGLKVEQGIVVDAQGRTSHADIFAAGDVAQHPQLGICLQSWEYAQNQAIVAARSMLDNHTAGYDEPAWVWSDQYDNNIQIVGIPAQQSLALYRQTGNSQLFFSLNKQNQLVQMVAFNDGRAIKLAKRWMASGRVLQPQQLTDPDFSLMTLR
ncbi:MAG: NAD(P)/FAD-dependent oxidoreductase [Enterobacteriaceae bacterium]